MQGIEREGDAVSIYYHRTDAVDSILRDGFRDARGSYGFATIELTGVFVSDLPLDINEGARGEGLLAIDLDEDLSDFEIIQEGSGYREWCVPAAILDQGTVRVVSQDEEDEMYLERLEARGSSGSTDIQ